MFKKLQLLLALCCATLQLMAGNVISYTAPEQLSETVFLANGGLHTDAFNAAVTSHTFNNGTGIITFAEEVTTVGRYAFNGCADMTSVVLPSSVTSIEKNAFADCRSLTSINLPDGITAIGEFAFVNCESLRSVTIPDLVSTVDQYVFSGCSGLEQVSMGAAVDTIGDEAFADCSALQHIWCYAAQVPFVFVTAFTSYDATLHVLCDLVESYKADEIFCRFHSIECAETDLEQVPSETQSTPDGKFMQNGHLYIRHANRTYNVTGSAL